MLLLMLLMPLMLESQICEPFLIIFGGPRVDACMRSGIHQMTPQRQHSRFLYGWVRSSSNRIDRNCTSIPHSAKRKMPSVKNNVMAFSGKQAMAMRELLVLFQQRVNAILLISRLVVPCPTSRRAPRHCVNCGENWDLWLLLHSAKFEWWHIVVILLLS